MPDKSPMSDPVGAPPWEVFPGEVEAAIHEFEAAVVHFASSFWVTGRKERAQRHREAETRLRAAIRREIEADIRRRVEALTRPDGMIDLDCCWRDPVGGVTTVEAFLKVLGVSSTDIVEGQGSLRSK